MGKKYYLSSTTFPKIFLEFCSLCCLAFLRPKAVFCICYVRARSCTIGCIGEEKKAGFLKRFIVIAKNNVRLAMRRADCKRDGSGLPCLSFPRTSMTCQSQRNMKVLRQSLVPRTSRRTRPSTDEPSAHPWHQISNSSCSKGRHFQVNVGMTGCALYESDKNSGNGYKLYCETIPRGPEAGVSMKGFFSGDNCVVNVLPDVENIAASEQVQYSPACCSFFSLSHSESSYSSEAASSSVIAGSGSSAKSALKNLATHSCPHGSSSRK